MDHVGPLTRSVQDAALVLEAIAGHDTKDPYSVQAPTTGSFDSSERSIKGTRIGVVRRFFFEGFPDVIEVVDSALDALVDRGAIRVELDIPDVETAYDAAGTTFAETAAVFGKEFAEHREAFSDELRGKLDWANGVGAKEYIEAQRFRRGFTNRVEQLFSECDVLVAPAATVTAMPISKRPSDYGRNGWKNSGIFNLTGHPSISVPCGFTKGGLPVGLMMTGQISEDWKVLRFASAFEQGTEWHKMAPEI
jgi:aspartyl-tRNA(Asn)/glutamyl-tRNA(Gln) amidotransferase subunit A